MSLYDIMYCIAALFILVTAVARLNDIKRTQVSVTWWARRIGLLMVVTSMAMFLASHVTTYARYWNEITKLLSIWGWALTWLTTPGMPPWWKYISGSEPEKANGD